MTLEGLPWHDFMDGDWKPTESLLPLDKEELQLWRIDLKNFEGSLDTYGKKLSLEERDRSTRLRKGTVQAQFVISRACLRLLLGFHLSLLPEEVPIVLGAYGKPEIQPIDGQNLFFNLAHSQSIIVIALSRSGAVGVDLEYLDRNTDIMEIASQVFSLEENEQFANIEDAYQRRLAFFHCWTRKEAVAKADGRGLSLPFSSFTVPMFRPASLWPVQPEQDRAATFYLSDLLLGPQIAAAFAVSTHPSRIGMFHFPAGLV